MKTDDLGIPKFSDRDLMELIYQGNQNKISDIFVEDTDDVRLFNKNSDQKLSIYQKLDVNKNDFDQALQAEWFMPDDYKNIDLYDYLMNLCDTNEEKTRTQEELEEFEKRGYTDLLKFLIYLVDTLKEKDILWGVGRGSSVASFVLYLIGIHRINSIQYGLDWHEFLR